jgi:hypothetical protein
MSAPLTLPTKVWGTKGFQFWTFLSLVLLASHPRRLLELGSGRSTLTFAEYALFAGAEFISIETSREWYHRTFLELHFTNLNTKSLKHVELDPVTGWYVSSQFRAAIKRIIPVECILIDAPNDDNGNSTGMRDTWCAIDELRAVCSEAELILVDDVHRQHVFSTVEQMLWSIQDYDFYYFEYRVVPAHMNALCICARRGGKAALAIPQIEKTLDLALARNWSIEKCPEP